MQWVYGRNFLHKQNTAVQQFWTMRRSGFRWMAWWYGAIAVGFALLALDHMVSHDKPWLIGVRLVIAAGFGFLSWMEFHAKNRKP
jgi:hypothetical protein